MNPMHVWCRPLESPLDKKSYLIAFIVIVLIGSPPFDPNLLEAKHSLGLICVVQRSIGLKRDSGNQNKPFLYNNKGQKV